MMKREENKRKPEALPIQQSSSGRIDRVRESTGSPKSEVCHLEGRMTERSVACEVEYNRFLSPFEMTAINRQPATSNEQPVTSSQQRVTRKNSTVFHKIRSSASSPRLGGKASRLERKGGQRSSASSPSADGRERSESRVTGIRGGGSIINFLPEEIAIRACDLLRFFNN